MTEYKPWFEKFSSMTEQFNSEELDYKSEYKRMVEENKSLCLLIGGLVSEKCKLTQELNKLKSEPIPVPVKTKVNKNETVFSNDCATAIKQLLEILKNNTDFRYTRHRQGKIEGAYYSIINNMDIRIFYLEDHSKNNYEPSLGGFALITSPSPQGIVEEYKHKYDSVCGNWSDRTTPRSSRKRYDIRGKKVVDVIDIFNQFR